MIVDIMVTLTCKFSALIVADVSKQYSWEVGPFSTQKCGFASKLTLV